MELKEEMYIRTRYGIKKIHHIDSNKTVNKYFYKLNDDYEYGYIKTSEVIKASFNIIDLIEVGDVISFYEDIDNYKKEYVIGIVDNLLLDNLKDKIGDDNIRLTGIMTKEQFENMIYKVGER